MFFDDAIRLTWFPPIVNVSGVQSSGFKDWLSSADYRILSPTAEKSFTITPHAPSDLAPGICNDISRFATACFETYQSLKSATPITKSTAWALVKLYYAAFYAAHSLLRMNGCSFSQLDTKELLPVRNVARLYSAGGVSPTGGPYSCTYDRGSSTVICQIAPGNGPHDALWRRFVIYLDALLAEVSSGYLLTAYASSVEERIRELRAVLASDSNGNGNWLSQMRNEIQYQQAFGAWYPYSGSTIQVAVKHSMASYGLKEIYGVNLTSSDKVEKMVNACIFIVGLLNGSVRDLSNRCAVGKTFLDSPCLAFVRKNKL